MRQQRVQVLEPGLLAFLTCLAAFSAAMLVWQSAMPQAIQFAGVIFDRLSALMAFLVAGVGTVAYHFSLRYLAGEPRQRRFMGWLFLTVIAAYLLMISAHLLLLFAAWSLTSLGLHQLLTFYRDRAEALRPARKKFLISRLGDLALLAAIGMIWAQWGTLDIREFLARASAGGDTTVVALLIVVAALTKSAQFPFHSWLPETMEAPTPVSALMHAGIINAGGVLLLRLAPFIVMSVEALFLLSLVGTFTTVLGVISMWAQTKVKRTLAWSTVSQMGFMMVQCGLAAFPAAALHIVGHGCYKAWSFLRSSEVPRQLSAAPASPAQTLALGSIGFLIALPALMLAAAMTGFDPFHSPGELALSGVVALSIGQLWIALLRDGSGIANIAGALALTVVVAFAAFGLYQGAFIYLTPVLGILPTPAGPLAWAAAILPFVAIAGLAILHALLPWLSRTPSGRAIYLHALHGFYFGLMADRAVDRVWRSFAAGRM